MHRSNVFAQWALVLGPAFIGSAPIGAHARTHALVRTCEAKFLSVVRPLDRMLVDLPAGVRAELVEAQHRFLDRRRAIGLGQNKVVPNAVTFERLAYRVDALLGQGFEGRAWLVEREGAHFILKEFFNERDRRENVAFAKLLKRRGFDVVVPSIVRERAVLYPYVDGINVGAVISPGRGEAPLVSAATAAFVQRAFAEYQERFSVEFGRFHPNGLQLILHSNVLLELNTGRFVIIDPK